MRRVLYYILLLPLLLSLSNPTFSQTKGRFDCRFAFNSIDCQNDLAYIDLEVRAATSDSTYRMGDQNYKFTYNLLAIANPRIVSELGFSFFMLQPYAPHSILIIQPPNSDIGLATVNITWIRGINGTLVPSGAWSPVCRLEFDITDPTELECLGLTWRSQENVTNFTNITEVEPLPPPGSAQMQPFTTTVDVTEGSYTNANPCLDFLCTPGNLPVEWASFEGELKGEDGFLTWVTSAEINADHFVVERSLDRRFFTEVGQISATGNTSQPSHYQFVDPKITSLNTAVIYYRLAQMDFDGNVNYSKVTEIFIDPDFQVSIEIYPNPVQDVLNVDYLSNGEGEVNIDIISVDGKLMHSSEMSENSGNLKLSVSNYASGVYFVRIYNESGIQTSKFVVR